MVYACTVLGIPFARVYHVLKFLARHTKTNPRYNVTLWKKAQEEFDAVCARVKQNDPMYGTDPTHHCILVTDAATSSTTGGAVLITPGGRVITATLQLGSYHSINDLEAQALAMGLQHFSSFLRYTNIHYFGDNTATLRALAATHSKSWHLNNWVDWILRFLADNSSRMLSHYVASADNIADGISRGATVLEPYHWDWISTLRVGGGWRWSCSRLTQSHAHTYMYVERPSNSLATTCHAQKWKVT